jgi:hypothetical protein
MSSVKYIHKKNLTIIWNNLLKVKPYNTKLKIIFDNVVNDIYHDIKYNDITLDDLKILNKNTIYSILDFIHNEKETETEKKNFTETEIITKNVTETENALDNLIKKCEIEREETIKEIFPDGYKETI